MTYQKGEFIEITVDGVSVKGICMGRSERYVDIEIVQPYQGVSHSCQIPLFAVGRIFNFSGERGDEKMRDLLKELYQDCIAIAKNIDKIKTPFFQTQKEVRNIQNYITNELRLEQTKKELKEALKKGEIDNKTHQEQVGTLKKKVEEETLKIYCLWQDFLKKNCGFTYNHYKQYLDFIKAQCEKQHTR